MAFNRHDLVMAIIDDASTEIPLAYPRPDQVDKRDGAIAGLEACRSLDDAAMVSLMNSARAETRSAMENRDARYWWHRMFEAQVEWVLNVLSAAMAANGMPAPAPYTARGILKAADILGTSTRD